MRTIKEKLYRNTLIQALQLIYHCDRKAFALKVVYTILLSLLPLANLYVLKLMVDGVTDILSAGNISGEAWQSMIGYMLIFCGISLLSRVVTAIASVNNDVLSQKLIDYINNLIQNQSVRLDMAYYDNPAYHDTFHRAQQEAAFRPVRILENFVSILGSTISLIGVLAMLVVASWKIIVIMVIAVFPSFCVKFYKSRCLYKFRRETTQDMRKSVYYGSVLSNVTFAKEVRVFGLAGEFRKRYVAIRKKLVAKLFRISRKLAYFDVISGIVEIVALFFVIIELTSSAAHGVISVGSFVMLFEAFRKGQSYMNSLVNGVSGLYEHKLFIGNLFEFFRLKPHILSPAHPLPFPERVESVEFVNIGFHYPCSLREGEKTPWVLQHFNLKADLGSINKLEGENGFGKSTLLKLLLRLYDPQQGEIRINGINIQQFDLIELRHHVSVIFQDHVRFYCTAKENIEFGDINHSSMGKESHESRDTQRLQEAIRLADAQPVIESLSKGLDTPLGRMFDHGEELSMGQWQRLALARQLYSQAPILIFDEPTAWMDVKARERFMQNLDELRKEKIVILISHIG